MILSALMTLRRDDDQTIIPGSVSGNVLVENGLFVVYDVEFVSDDGDEWTLERLEHEEACRKLMEARREC